MGKPDLTRGWEIGEIVTERILPITHYPLPIAHYPLREVFLFNWQINQEL